MIIDSGEKVERATQGEGEEAGTPPLLPELGAWKAAPILTNEMIRLGEEASAAKLGEGEGPLMPPLIPEIVQTNTNVILGSSPDPGGMTAKAGPLPPFLGIIIRIAIYRSRCRRQTRGRLNTSPSRNPPKMTP